MGTQTSLNVKRLNIFFETILLDVTIRNILLELFSIPIKRFLTIN